MRKETINTFSEGLISDLHPLNTPNNVLTDALNATLITYDGNEYLLQNDLGNGKVETARLPAGYIPVGLKEYGGIIYVASYNPLTGKSQLGSFPSPERQISTEELGRTFTINSNINTDNAYIRLDIYDENKQSLYRLNPGDKFIIGSAGISRYLTGYEGIIDIHVGVVDKENNITYIEEDLEKPYIVDSSNIESNNNFQVFTSKTSGYLTIIVELKTIDSFNLTKTITLDEISNTDSIANVAPSFSVLFTGNYETSSGINVLQFKLNSNSVNAYSTTDLKLGINKCTKNDVLDYTITPICNYGLLSSFAVSGKIDFSILGTGYNNLIEWRYYVDNDYLRLSWGLDYDPIKFVKVSEVTFEFIDLQAANKVIFKDNQGTDKSYYKCGDKDNYNGIFSEKIPFKNNKTNRGLTKNKMYFVTINIKYINQSGNDIEAKTYYRIVYTTGIFNQQYIEYNVSDFKDLSVTVPLNINVSTEVNNVTLTPNVSNTPIVSIEDPFMGVSSIYSVEGNLKLDYGIKDSKLFGEPQIEIIGESDEYNQNMGLSIKVPKSFTEYTVNTTPNYLGTSLAYKDTLETKFKEKYTDYGNLDIESATFNTKNENEWSFSLGGEVFRGLFVAATKDVTVETECYIPTQAVSNVYDLNEFIGNSIYGTPNNFDNNHLEVTGSVLCYNRKDGGYWFTGGTINGDIDGISSKDKSWTRVAKVNQIGTALDSLSVNQKNSSGLQHPIMLVCADSYEENGFGIGKSVTINSYFKGVRYDNNVTIYDDCILVAWKVADGSYIFLNLGGVIAWNNDTTSGGVSLGEKSRYGSYEFAMLRGSQRLTTVDILYHFLSNLYIPQWTKSNITTISPDLDAIVYHGNFDSNFEAKFKVKFNINESKLFGFNSNNKLIHMNYEEISDFLKTGNFGIKSDADLKDIEVNCNYISAIANGEQDTDLSINYSVGNNLSLTNWYSRLVALGESGFKTDSDKVYTQDSTNTKDANGNELDSNTIYIKQGDNFSPFKGEITYSNGMKSNVKSDFLVIKRPSDKTKKATLYATTNYCKYNLAGQVGGNNDVSSYVTISKIDSSNILYPNSQVFNI